MRTQSHARRIARRIGIILPLVLTAASPTACVSHVFRHASPGSVQRVGLDVVEDDLIIVNVVHGLLPRHQTCFVIAVPQGWQLAPAERRADGCFVLTSPMALVLLDPRDRTVPERQVRFAFRDTSTWSAETRGKYALREPAEMEPADRRDYEIVNVRLPDGAVEMELRGRRADGQVRVLGLRRLPAEVTPGELSTAEVVLLTPPLAVINVAWVPLTWAAVVALIPFGSLYHIGADEETLPHPLETRAAGRRATFGMLVQPWSW